MVSSVDLVDLVLLSVDYVCAETDRFLPAIPNSVRLPLGGTRVSHIARTAPSIVTRPMSD